MDSSKSSQPQAGAGRKSWGRRLLGCSLGVAGIALLSAAFLVWYFWQPPNLVCTAVIDAHARNANGKSSILGLAFSPDCTQLASGASDGMAKVWDPIAKTERRTFLHQKETVTTLAFSPDGRTLAVGDRNCLITLWDTETWTPRLAWPADYDTKFPMVRRVLYSPDGRLIASYGVTTVTIWDAKTGKERIRCAAGAGRYLQSAALSPDGRQVAACYRNGVVYVLDTDTGTERAALTYPYERFIRHVAFSPDGKTVVASICPYTFDLTAWGRVVVWDLASGQVVSDVAVGRTMYVDLIAYSPDGKLLACSGGKLFEDAQGDWATYLLDATNWRVLAQAKADGVSSSPEAIAFSPDGNQLVTSHLDGALRFWDVTPWRNR